METDGSKPKSPTESVASIATSTRNRFETVEECLEYIQKPHRSWDSAMKEMARIEAQKEAASERASDTSSVVSAVSARSTTSSVTSSVRRGRFVGLPPRAASQAPAQADIQSLRIGLAPTAASVRNAGGFTFTTVGKSRSMSGREMQNRGDDSARSTNSSRISDGPVAGTPCGPSGVRGSRQRMPHPQSAPEKKNSARARQTSPSPPPTMDAFVVSGGSISLPRPPQGSRR